MRIVVDVSPLLEKYGTGVSKYTYNLLECLFKLDLENEYYLFYNSYKNNYPILPDFGSAKVQVCDYHIPNKLLNLSILGFNYPSMPDLIYHRFNLRPDVVFSPNLSFLALAGSGNAHNKKIHSVITIHDLSFKIYPEFYNLKNRLKHYLVNVKKTCLQADKIITVSESSKTDIINYLGIPENKITVIYHGAQSVRKDINTRVVCNGKVLPEHYILYLGTLEMRKNIISIIKSFQQIMKDNPNQNLILILVGHPGYGYTKILQAIQAAGLSLVDKIWILNYVSEEDKARLYQGAELFVFPSYYEGFGLPVIEAMSYGVPVISSFSSSLGEIVGSAGILINPDNISELTLAMQELLTNSELRQIMSTAGLQRSAKFTFERTARETLKVFQGCKQVES